ncbi:MAG TPA: Crp/Fnr family transcriptional regulator [Candidatus Limnocylindria bacterium]|nr:Crp/Fnr family transcriptional regulator [Candidatus Limnocylindria bacterium]
MATPRAAAVTLNSILDGLTPDRRAKLLRLGTLRRVRAAETAYEAGETIRRVYFPSTALGSLLVQFAGGETVEAAVVGREGVVGLPLWLGARATPLTVIWQLSGDVWEFPASIAADPEFGALRPLVDRYCVARLAELGVQSACNRLHSIRQRAARWLLTVADRAGREDLELTHQFVAAMLGSHRPRVSAVLHELAADGLIAQRRGAIQLADRGRLTRAACECYALIRSEYERLGGR